MEKPGSSLKNHPGDDCVEMQALKPTTRENPQIVPYKKSSTVNEIRQRLKTNQQNIMENFYKNKPQNNSWVNGSDNKCVTFIIVAENYKREVLRGEGKLQTFKERIAEIISENEFQKIANGEILVPQEEMHLLNYFAYMRDVRLLSFLFVQINEKKFPILVNRDATGRDLLEIAIDSKDLTLLSLITKNLIENPPLHNQWPGFDMNMLIKLANLKCAELGRLIDSRLFIVESSNTLYTGTTREIRITYTDELALNQEDLNNLLKPSEDDGIPKQAVVLMVSDIKGIVGGSNSKNLNQDLSISDYKSPQIFFDRILMNYKRDDDIFISKTLEAILNYKWYRFGKYVFIVDLLYMICLWVYYALVANILDYANRREHFAAYNIVILIIGYIILLREIYGEINQAFKRGIKEGLKNYLFYEKNLMDLYYVICWTIYLVFNSLIVYKELNIDDDPYTFELFFIFRSFSNFALCLRTIWLFQINIRFGFMLRVIVYSSIKTLFFFIVFILLVISFVIGIGGLMYIKDDWNAAWNMWLSYFLYTYKLALGDFGDFFELLDTQNATIRSQLIYFFFGAATVILTIILLNLLITILGEAYSSVKEKEMNYINSTVISVLTEIDENYTLRQEIRGGQNLTITQKFFHPIKCFFYMVFGNKILTTHKTSGKHLLLAIPQEESLWPLYLDINNISDDRRLVIKL